MNNDENKQDDYAHFDIIHNQLNIYVHNEKEIVVNIGANQSVVIDKLYGPLSASEVRVRLQHKDEITDWVVEYRNPTTEHWEEKARWDCQENWPVKYDVEKK